MSLSVSAASQTAPSEAIAQRPFAIAVAPNGARRTKADHPRLPMSPAELARDAAEALEAGAAMIHLHVRDASGAHILDADLYREAEAEVRRAIGDRLVVQITTEAVGRYSAPEQIALIDALQPESVSVALREIFPEDGNEAEGAALFERMEAAGTLWQLILYDIADVQRMAEFQQRGLLPSGCLPILPVLGRYSGTGASASEIDAFLAAGVAQHAFMTCAFGPKEASFIALGAARGGHARVGFENNLWLPNGDMAPANADLVRAMAEAAAPTGRKLASADELRAIWRSPAEG